MKKKIRSTHWHWPDGPNTNPIGYKPVWLTFSQNTKYQPVFRLLPRRQELSEQKLFMESMGLCFLWNGLGKMNRVGDDIDAVDICTPKWQCMLRCYCRSRSRQEWFSAKKSRRPDMWKQNYCSMAVCKSHARRVEPTSTDRASCTHTNRE